MVIGIEAQRIFRRNKHGMDYVVLEEIRCLQQLDHENEYYVFVFPGPDRCIQSTENVHIIEVKCPTYPLWEQWALPRAVHRYPIQLLHCTSNTAPLYCKVPLVLTLHDIIFLEPRREGGNHSLYQNLGWYYRKLVVPRLINKCVSIITVSDYERANICNRFPQSAEIITRIYNGYSEWFRPQPTPYDFKLPTKPGYIFFLGNTDPKKNTQRTILAYARYVEQSKVKRPLLLADFPESQLTSLLHRIGHESLRDHIILMDYISNRELPYIYNNAFAFLYTSLRESFGIPLLEGMACGTPVVASNTSSLPEIAGDYPLLVNPEDVGEIAQTLLGLENGSYDLNVLKQMGMNTARHFSWKQTASQLLNLYKSIL